MDQSENIEQRRRFFTEKSVELAFGHSKFFLMLFTGIVTGLLLLLCFWTFGFWITVWLLLAELSAVAGMAASLLHLANSTQVIGRLAEKYANDHEEAILVGSADSASTDLAKIRAYAQLCYASQLKCLFASACFASLAIVARHWDNLGWFGLCIALILLAGVVIAAFRPSIWVEHDARVISSWQPARPGPVDA